MTVDSPVGADARPDASEGVLLARLARLRERVAGLVEERSEGDPTAADPLRGLYLSGEAVQHHLGRFADPRYAAHGHPDGPSEWAGAAEVPAVDDRLHRLARSLQLTALDTDVLLIALAPDLDRGFEPLYGYLNDDVSRRRATVGLALDVCGLPPTRAAARDRFRRTAPLSALGLLIVEEPERPFLSRSLRVPDRLAAHLLGDDAPDAALDGYVRALETHADGAYAPQAESPLPLLAEHLATTPLTVYLRERRDGDGLRCAATVLRAAGREALHFTPELAPARGPGRAEGAEGAEPAPDERHGTSPYGPVPELLREARLRGCAIVVSPLPERPGPLIRALAVPDVPVLFAGTGPYDPQWCESDPLVLDVPRTASGAVDTWSAALGLGTEEDPGFDLAASVAPYRLGGDRIARAARTARELAAFEGTALTADHVRLAARQQSASGLERHARRIRPAVGWDDLVLPEERLGHLRELALRARHRDRVLGDWRLSAGGGRGRGVLALFAGDSGTGKTLSAEVVAGELGLDLYVVQLSSVVDKYVGETQKNLERIFTEADSTDAVLLFDEADAVFGKRSEVKDAHDRYANMESAYLLQRLESFDGIALLTTNLRANIDDAFTRRLDLVVDFPFPDAEQRLALWRHSLAHVPCAESIDPSACARDFELSGGSIRSAVVTAAYTAAGRGEPVATADLLAGARREYRKAGRLVPGDVGW
ncbi:ATP-binding protein [Streptomyces sp. NBC_01387]|uniref:ATP-binding protein n=1 Tax=unclassified Streptomyces TaxID=2593676 RepID=UPI0020257551|nr:MULTISPECIES: ATP-binding protein [unclassified Streptomyces]MCX4549393.1 ATP-binding protein [Streptomyces sp. NBC_01500]WSV54938.1 ATP-binding protein [Streptomyces sp. NBC_01014]